MTQWPDRKTHSKVVADHENYFVEYVTRGDSGNNPETHGHNGRLYPLLDGEGTITLVAAPRMGRATWATPRSAAAP